MSVLIAHDAWGRGFDMSGLSDGVGVFYNDPSVSVTYLRPLDDYTLAYEISGSPPVAYMTISGTVNLITGDAIITDILYFDSDIEPVITWSEANILFNINDDFSIGGIVSVLNGNDYISGNSYADLIKASYGNDYSVRKQGQ